MTNRSRKIVIATALAVTAGYQALGQCEGLATAMTTDTRHSNCLAPMNALQWTLNIICLDACGQVWYSAPPQTGSATGACDFLVRDFCAPSYYRESYTSGMYAETSAFNQYLLAGCQDGFPTITQGNCPCAPPCGTNPSDPGSLNKDDPPPSPIVVDLDRRGFRFTDLGGGVRFDLDADGIAESISWSAADSGDGWLALDRNHNGTIDSGAELFGNFTPQPASAEPHGFHALAFYDRAVAGGDGDGAITDPDAVFSSLRIWVDGNRDAFSQGDELIPLIALGIEAIELDFVTSRRRDAHGNELRYASRVRLTRGTTQCADVFLLGG